MSHTKEPPSRIAVLIDGDNIAAKCAAEIVTKVQLRGRVVTALVFSDFTTQESAPWSTLDLAELGLTRVQVDRNEPGDNSTDKALIAQAVALSASSTLDAICVASSDGDFACLADQLKKARQNFLVAAPMNASHKLIDSCDEVIPLDGDMQAPMASSLNGRDFLLLNHAIAMHRNKHQWAKISAVSDYLECHSPAYARSKWGYSSLQNLLDALGCFAIARYQGGALRVRRKKVGDSAS